MFIVMGSGQKEKILDFEQVMQCDNCSTFSTVQIIMVYSYFMLFFIPLFKWNKRYYAQMSCCGSTCELDKELGAKIERKEITRLEVSDLAFRKGRDEKCCMHCGYMTKEDFEYCPKCGNKLI